MRKRRAAAELGPIKPFNAAEFEELKTLLHVDSREAYLVAALIHEAALRMRATQEVNRLYRGKSDTKALGQVEGFMRVSANYLESLGVGHPLMRALRENGWSTDSISDFIGNLRRVSQLAGDLVNDPAAYRRALGLPDRSQNAVSIESAVLWPVLLKIWQRVHGDVKLSKDGPLMRFIEFGHRHAGLPHKPEYEAVRPARKRQKPKIEAALEEESHLTAELTEAEEMARALRALEAIYHQTG